MIKVELMYNVSMLGFERMMTEEEYKEFRETALNLPLATIYPTVKEHKAAEEIDFMGNPVDRLAEFIMLHIPGEPSRSEGAVDTAIRLLKERCEPDQAEECPEYIEPPAPEVICENGACRLVIPEEVTETPEKITETPEKLTKEPKKNLQSWQKYIDMGNDGASKDEIKEVLMQDKSCKASVAGIYYARYVLPNVKFEKIEILEEEKPTEGKYFTESDRARIQRMAGIK